MLSALSIRDIVLIEALDLEFSGGLTVLTGETGAGKSILLDSLSLAIGARADRALVREGCDRGMVSAVFDLRLPAPYEMRLDDAGVPVEDSIMLRRQVTKDGRSKAWINDTPVSQALLKEIGGAVIEIHGQHDDRILLEPVGHRALLDQYANDPEPLRTYEAAWEAAEQARVGLEDAEHALTAARDDEEFLRHAVEELQSLNLQPGEEAELSETRATMMQGEKLAGDLSDFQKSLRADGGVDAKVRGILRRMERLDGEAQTLLAPVMESLARAAIELDEGVTALDRLAEALDFSPEVLEDTETRLFELRRVARKHNCEPDALMALLKDFEQRVQAVDHGDASVEEARAALKAAEEALEGAAASLHHSRSAAATRLDQAVVSELPPLKLEKASFRTTLEQLPRSAWSRAGSDHVEFEVKTNPSTPYGPLTKIASGGETARFVLALKVVLAAKGSVPVMVFDEVDRGIGGATADAVGERLARLSATAQILVVTHSPQVAARGARHLNIAKSDTGAVTRTNVAALSDQGRREEIARMLAGAEITEEARAAADRLMAQTLAAPHQNEEQQAGV